MKNGSRMSPFPFHNSSLILFFHALLTINGDSKEVFSVTIADLMTELSLPAPLMLVEHNGKALHRSEWSEVTLGDGDRLEIMKVAAGG